MGEEESDATSGGGLDAVWDGLRELHAEALC